MTWRGCRSDRRRRSARELYAALDALPEGERAVFELTALDELTPRQAAAALGIRPVTARVRLHRARAALRAELTIYATAGGMMTVRGPAPDRAPTRGGRASGAAATPRRGKLIALGATAAAAIAAALAVALGGGSAAYAVEPGANGSVTVQIHDLSDAAGLQSALRDAGVPAVVTYSATAPSACGGAGVPPAAPPSETGGGEGPTTTRHNESGSSAKGDGPTFNTDGARGPQHSGPVTTKVEKTADGVTFTLDAGALPADAHVYITTQTGKVEGIGMAIC